MRMSFNDFGGVAPSLAISSQALAQAPAATPATRRRNPSAGGTPDAMPFDIPYGMSIGLEKRQAGDGGGRSRSQEAQLEDEHRGRRYQRRARSCSRAWKAPRSPPGRFSINKARTAARFRRETRLFYNAYETGHSYVAARSILTLTASPGGFPLVEGGKLIGAIGCSGGTGDQDAAICKVGAEIVK